MEVASFYTCDETWNQEDEIRYTGDVLGEQIMSDYKLSDILTTKIRRLSMFMILSTCGHFLLN
jgi:hypothetical protein